MTLLEMSLSGAVFILAVAVVRAALIHKLPKMTFVVLWEMALFRLLIPVPIPSVLSVYTLLSRGRSLPSFETEETDRLILTISQRAAVTVQGMEQLPADSPSVPVGSLVWCIGMILFAAFFIFSCWCCRKEFRTALPVDHAFAEQWLKERTLKRPISIKQSDRITAPLTYGIFRPVILMPKKTDWENTDQLAYILFHEYIHICRLDALTKLAAASVLCVHWFNPFVWMMYFLMNRDMELACDERVVRQFGEQSRSAYSLLLIRMEAAKSGLSPFCSSFSKNAAEERITAIMSTKPTTPVTFLSASLIVLVTACLFATSVAASPGHSPDVRPASRTLQTDAADPAADKKGTMSMIHESADILHYENGAPYIHDILTNNTDRTITETQYCMLAYDENGSPLKLHWNFTDSSAESSFANIVRSEEHLLPGQTEEYRGGWSLYDREETDEFSDIGNDGACRAAYILFCLEQVVFEDGTVWNNPYYKDWRKTFEGKEKGTDELQHYYPHEYRMESD